MLKKDLYKFLVLDFLQLVLSFVSSNFSLFLSYYTRNTTGEFVFIILSVGLAYSTLYSFNDIIKSIKEYRMSNYV